MILKDLTLFFSGTVDSAIRTLEKKNDSGADILLMHVGTRKRRDSSWLAGYIHIFPEMSQSHVSFFL